MRAAGAGDLQLDGKFVAVDHPTHSKKSALVGNSSTRSRFVGRKVRIGRKFDIRGEASEEMSTTFSDVSNVLILRAIGLGDFLTAVPAYRGLRQHFPDAVITLAASAVLEPLAGLTGAIDRLLPVNGLGELAAMSGQPDLAVNLHGAGPESIQDLLATGARRLLTHRHPQFPSISGPEWTEDVHEVERWTRLLNFSGIP